MSEINNRVKEIADTINEHIIAVKGTLELVEASVSEDELHELLLKAIGRMDSIQKLSDEVIGTLKQILDKMNEMKTAKTDAEGKTQA